MRFSSLVASILIFYACQSRNSSSTLSQSYTPSDVISKEGEFGDINNEGLDGLVIFALDTNPNEDSLIYRKIVKNLGYKYKMFRSEKDHPMPAFGPMFKQALWYHRTLRYIAELKKLENNDVVIFSDVRDVTFFGSANETLSEFKKLDKKIIISSTFQCCTVNYIPYVKKYAKKIGYPWNVKNEAFPTPEEQKEIKILWNMYFENEESHLAQSNEIYGRKWPNADFINNYKLKEQYFHLSNNQYANAGTIIGYRDDFLKAFEQMDPQPWYDDEETWNYWFSKLPNYSEYTLDFKDNIFGIVTSTSRPKSGELKQLFLEKFYPENKFPYKKFFRFTVNNGEFVSYWGGKTKIFHCPGCSTKEVNEMRKKIVELLIVKYPALNKFFTEKEKGKIGI